VFSKTDIELYILRMIMEKLTEEEDLDKLQSIQLSLIDILKAHGDEIAGEYVVWMFDILMEVLQEFYDRWLDYFSLQDLKGFEEEIKIEQKMYRNTMSCIQALPDWFPPAHDPDKIQKDLQQSQYNIT